MGSILYSSAKTKVFKNPALLHSPRFTPSGARELRFKCFSERENGVYPLFIGREGMNIRGAFMASRSLVTGEGIWVFNSSSRFAEKALYTIHPIDKKTTKHHAVRIKNGALNPGNGRRRT
jgi:hypothetical protein